MGCFLFSCCVLAQAGYNSPFAVVHAAREQIEQESAGQTRPDDPITGEYMKMERQRSIQDSVDSG